MEFPPIFASEEEATRAYMACGKVALNWGPVELAIENFVILLRHLYRADVTEKFPLPFSQKLKAAEKLLNLDTANREILDLVRPLFDSAKELHKIRVDIVHSICQGTDLNGVLIFGKSDQKRRVSYTETRYTISQIDVAAEDMRSVRASLELAFSTLRMRP